MTKPNICDMTLLVQADFDGELSAGEAARVELHCTQCAICQQAYQDLVHVREEIRAMTPSHVASPEFQLRLAELWPKPVRTWRAFLPVGAVIAAALVVVMMIPRPVDLTDQVIAGHIRAMQPGHLTDVMSTDKHTVKPWFDGKLDFAPPVKNLAAQGFPLKGGRLDYLNDRPVAALVYERGLHPINLFVWPDSDRASMPNTAAHNGYNVIHFHENGVVVWIVSDLESEELGRFVALWRATP